MSDFMWGVIVGGVLVLAAMVVQSYISNRR